MTMTQQKAVILVSGGVDSSTLLGMVSNRMNYEIYALTFSYGQRHSVEIQKIKEFIKDYKIKQHKIINIELASFDGSALTDHNIDVPKYNDAKELEDNIPITYVPARNTIFLSYALGYAEIIRANDIFIAVHAHDYSNYPDCRPEYIKSFEEMANLAIKPKEQGQRVKIHAPLINLTKSEIIAEGMKLGVDYSKTISCYDPQDNGASCSKCHACLLRLEGFAKNNLTDPILYK